MIISMTVPVHRPQENTSHWTAQTIGMGWHILERMERAVTKVRDRLLRATAALNQAGAANFRVIALEPVVPMKLMPNRRKDQVHMQDLIGVGLVDRSWLTRFPPELAERLKEILDTPDA
jgi:hypothetical protein